MREPVLGIRTDDGTAPDPLSAWSMLFFVGLALAALGMVDLALLFYPAQWASLEWEFATFSGVIEGLPLVTFGLGVMTASAAARGWVAGRRLMVVVLLLMVVAVLAATTIFELDVPAVLRAVNVTVRPSLKKAAVKTGMMGLMHVGTYATLGLWTWRRLRTTVKGV
jgi:hypothetical protein